MKLVIGKLFAEPEYQFNISHYVTLYIKDLLIKNIMDQNELTAKDENIFLSLIITTNSKTTSIEVKGPSFNKKSGFINYGLWLPYEPIVKSENYLRTFIEYLFDSLIILFSKYSVKEEDIKKIQKIAEKEILNNPKYQYVDLNA